MKKRLLKALSLILVIAICFGSFSYAFGAILLKKETIEVPLLQEGSFEQPSEVRDYYKSSGIATFQSDETAMEYIYRQLLDYKTSFNIYSYKIPATDFMTLYCEAVNRHPDLFYVSSSVEYNRVKTDNCVYNVTPNYSIEQDKAEEAKTTFENGVQKALSKIDPSMNDLQKCLVLHDYVCDIATYPKVFDSNGQPTYDKDIYHSAYGLFYDGNVVCAGYTLAYSYLLSRVGIETKHVTSDIMSHAWNKVKIDGKWYNVDLTYDDDISYNGEDYNTRGAMRHLFFAKSDDCFMSETGYYHYGGRSLGDVIATDKTYDDYFWNDIDTFIPVVEGNYYYLTPSNPQSLVKRTNNGEETIILKNISSTEADMTRTIYDKDQVEHEISNVDYLNRLVYLDNKFYFNETSHKFNNGVSEIYNSIRACANIDGVNRKLSVENDVGNYINGLSFDENDNLVFQIINDTNTYTLDKLDYFEQNITLPNKTMSVLNSVNYNIYADINLDKKINAKDYAMIKAKR